MSSPWRPEGTNPGAHRGSGLRVGPQRGRNPVLLTAPVGTVADVARDISAAVFGPDRPAPENLDGLADVLREARVTRVAASDWRLSAGDTRRVEEVFRDIGVRLSR